MKDNSLPASTSIPPASAADHRARRTRRVREKKAASKWLARHSDPPPAFEHPEEEETGGVTETPTLPPVFNSGAPNAVDASMPEEELAAKLEATTVRPPSNPPVSEAEAKVEAPLVEEPKTDDSGDVFPIPMESERGARDDSREVDTVPPMRAREALEEAEEPIDERASGIPPKRSGRVFMLAILLCAIGGAIFGIRKLQHRAPKPQVTQATPPPPEAKAAPPVVATTKPAEPQVVIPAGDPVAEREEARKLLEVRKAGEALPHAQLAVDIDPTEAQSWLVLGAAHQDLGHGVAARDAFLECTKQAKTGPIHECRSLLSYNGPR